MPEVVLGEGKTEAQLLAIVAKLLERSDRLLVTRLQPEAAQAIARAVPDAKHHELARCITVERMTMPKHDGVAVLSAGTADLPVAEEAALTAELAGNQVERMFDVGVAGLHRLMGHREALEKAEIIVVIAGMEGALPSVVGGLFTRPVIDVPTSIG